MKNKLLTIVFIVFSFSASAQNNWFWFNPFSFQPTTFMSSIHLVRDTSGVFWYGAYDGVNSNFHIVDQNHNYDIVRHVGGSNLYNALMIDSRNDMWCNTDGTWAHNRSGLDTMVILHVPITNWYPAALGAIVDDHHGNDYMLSWIQNSNYPSDTVYLSKYNGTTFQNYLLSDTFSDISVSLRSILCDYSGNLYLTCGTHGLRKFDGVNWTQYPIADTNAIVVFADYKSNIYIASDTFVLKFDGSQFDTIYLPTYPLPIDYTWGLANKPDSSVWLLPNTEAFYKLNSDNTWNYTYAPNFGSVWIGQFGGMFSPIFDDNGVLWTASDLGYSPYYFGLYSLTGHNIFSGKMFLDANENHVVDSTEVGLYGQNVLQTPNNFVANTDTGGNYSVVFIDSTVSHIVSTAAPNYFHFTTPSTYSINPNTDSLCCYNFGFAPDGNIQDLEVTVTGTRTGKGFRALRWLSYQNKGTIPVSDTISYLFDTALTFINAYPPADYISGNTIKWSFQNLQPFQLKNITLIFQTSFDIAMGAFVNDTAIIQPVVTDTTPVNNVFHNSDFVTAAFDPNEKTVSSVSGVNAGDELTYTIFFQNTGNDTAHKVVIKDTLSNNLNASTFRILGYSHPMTYKLKNAGEVAFTFDNIMLPDSNVNEPLSHGFVKYAIKINSNLPLGSTIQNTAGIYFDFNQPIATNTVSTLLGFNGINKVELGQALFAVYPNPATNTVTVEMSNNELPDEFKLVDITGRIVLQKRLNSTSKFSVATPIVAKGMYVVTLWNNGQCIGRKKLMIE